MTKSECLLLRFSSTQTIKKTVDFDIPLESTMNYGESRNKEMYDQEDNSFNDQILSRYKKLEKVGKGTYGIVYRAMDLQTNEEVALKKVIIHVNFPFKLTQFDNFQIKP